jgi:hypothetical protein
MAIECPGRDERQFLPGERGKAKEWADKQTCSKTTRCPKEKPCEKQLFIIERKRYIVARVMCTCPSSGGKKAVVK